MRVLIADDEAAGRRRLSRMLESMQDVEVVGEAENGTDAWVAIQQLRPDLVLLDIEMPELDGLSVAAKRGLPPVIFVTAHEDYAVRAFDLNAVDYLLKPVRPDRLARAVDKARANLSSRGNAGNAPTGPRVASREGGTVRFFDAAEITRFRASHKYTVFQVDGVEHLTEESLSTLEARLAGFGFIRVHRAELVRRSAIQAVTLTSGEHVVVLEDGQVASVSRRLGSQLKRQLNL